MKQFNFSTWSMRNLAENTLTGGGYYYHDMKFTQIDGERVLAMADRKNVGHRVKFAEALEDAAKGNRYRISVRVRLGEECSVDNTKVTVGILELFALYPAFIHEPKTVTKKEWTTIEFTHTLADDSHSVISVEQSGENTPLAEVVNLSESRAAHVFKESVGKSPHRYISEVKISNSKTLLLDTDMSVAEISRLVGYDDPLYFSRAFKAIVGASPKKYRGS